MVFPQILLIRPFSVRGHSRSGDYPREILLESSPDGSLNLRVTNQQHVLGMMEETHSETQGEHFKLQIKLWRASTIINNQVL